MYINLIRIQLWNSQLSIESFFFYFISFFGIFYSNYFDILAQTRENDLELLCLDGSKRPISEYNNCNWGLTPTDAIVTTSAKSSSDRFAYQKWLQVFYFLIYYVTKL